MVLVDTSVWVEHFRYGKIGLESLLDGGHVVCHAFIIGELACGNLKGRAHIFSLLHALPAAIVAEHHEVIHFIEQYRLMGKGLGYLDMHLLASAVLTKTSLWTIDKKLLGVSSSLGIKAETQ